MLRLKATHKFIAVVGSYQQPMQTSMSIWWHHSSLSPEQVRQTVARATWSTATMDIVPIRLKYTDTVAQILTNRRQSLNHWVIPFNCCCGMQRTRTRLLLFRFVLVKKPTVVTLVLLYPFNCRSILKHFSVFSTRKPIAIVIIHLTVPVCTVPGGLNIIHSIRTAHTQLRWHKAIWFKCISMSSTWNMIQSAVIWTIWKSSKSNL